MDFILQSATIRFVTLRESPPSCRVCKTRPPAPPSESHWAVEEHGGAVGV
jgi:hypothetical protein